MGDFVKGKAWQQYPAGIRKGILLHRAIDTFTDKHPLVHQNVDRIRPFAGRYSAPVVDILFDHLLCNHWATVAPGLPFDVFADWAYASLEAGSPDMPEELQRRWPHMRAGRFLHGYRQREGLEWVMRTFAKRLLRPIDGEGLLAYFFEKMADFSADFLVFYPELDAHCRQFRDQYSD
ncbi:MAG: DUF479 domain-containing protein [Saprospiraceae bacterium]|nr:DUF479 domain-containing protein [Saprospiraceae bacterium]